MRYAQLTAPATVPAGVTFTATARFVNQGNIPITDGSVHLRAPAGWKVVPVARRATLSLPAGESTTRSFRVTAPEQAQGNTPTLTATLSSAGIDGAGDVLRDDDDPGAARDYREVTYDGGRRSGAVRSRHGEAD